MKRIILLLTFGLLATAGSAQHVGLKGGATYANFWGEDAAAYTYRVGYTAGAFYQYHFNPVMGVQVEGLFTSKGARREVAPNTTDTYRLNYIDVPVLFHVSTANWFFDLGPQASFIAGARQLRDAVPADGTVTTSRTILTDNPYPIDWALVAGIGYRAPNGVGLELRYAPGVKRIDDEGPMVGADRKNNPFYLMASYLIR